MTPFAQSAAGLAVAAGIALLPCRRPGGMAALCAVQSLAVAVAALAEGAGGAAALILLQAAAVAALSRWPRFPDPPSARRAAPPPLLTLTIAAMLVGIAASVPTLGLPLAIILPGLLLLASRSAPAQQALGVAAMQNGLVLAAAATGLAAIPQTLVALPILPALAFGSLLWGLDRDRTDTLRASPVAGRVEAGLGLLALGLACALPWQAGASGPLWRLDALGALATLLVAATVTAAAWAARDAGTVPGARLAILAGSALALLADGTLTGWAGLVLASAGATAAAMPVRAEAWRRLRLGCTGLGLLLFGGLGLHAGPATLPAVACLLVGYLCLAVLAPELTVAAVALILRLRGPAIDELCLAAGLAALLVGGVAPLGGTSPRLRLPLAGLAQGGVAVFAHGLGTAAGDLAALLQLGFLGLSQSALALATPAGLDRLAALAGIAGAPPFGVFPSLALVLLATAGGSPWLLLPLGLGLAAAAWSVLSQLPAGRRASWSLAWLPLALLLIGGFAMPHPLLAWLRLAAQ
jgi:hypothetical protein